MKLIIATALAVSLACPALAETWGSSFRAMCTNDTNEIEKQYGKLVTIFAKISNRGFGLLFMGNEGSEILIISPEPGVSCVIWDNRITPEGDPA